ncbi:MAG TPA: PEP-CTERM sorting domain-containing protein [Phycisphaerales bacterium]|nr:PEP-CTERM sorting domain-containing protein [Phycisphaerales bacterium]HRQ74423.1 PEP-CTERM sorting domain-containing protein [Phycisphaerales bacterium]
MKRSLVYAIAASCCFASTAVADLGWDPNLDQAFILNGGQGFTLVGGQSITFEVWVDPNPNVVIGFSFAGVISGISGNAIWASDTRLDIVAPNGATYDIGGFGAGGSPNPWDFQGSQSTNDGLYSHGHGSPYGDGQPAFVFDKIPKGGLWSFTFTQTFGTTPVLWKGVTIVLHKQVPAPGALALLGLAGFIGTSRRRRA